MLAKDRPKVRPFDANGVTNTTPQNDFEPGSKPRLPKDLVEEIENYICPDDLDPEQLFSYCELMEKLIEKESLSEEQQKRFDWVYKVAKWVLQSAESAAGFMIKPHMMLEGKTPFKASLEEDGAKKVEGILIGAYFGIAV